jgi:hypothetical protein
MRIPSCCCIFATVAVSLSTALLNSTRSPRSCTTGKFAHSPNWVANPLKPLAIIPKSGCRDKLTASIVAVKYAKKHRET